MKIVASPIALYCSMQLMWGIKTALLICFDCSMHFYGVLKQLYVGGSKRFFVLRWQDSLDWGVNHFSQMKKEANTTEFSVLLNIISFSFHAPNTTLIFFFFFVQNLFSSDSCNGQWGSRCYMKVGRQREMFYVLTSGEYSVIIIQLDFP